MSKRLPHVRTLIPSSTSRIHHVGGVKGLAIEDYLMVVVVVRSTSPFQRTDNELMIQSQCFYTTLVVVMNIVA